jgi:hypothetical protein
MVANTRENYQCAKSGFTTFDRWTKEKPSPTIYRKGLFS